MTTEEKIYLASKAADKGWDYETLKYGDDLYSESDKGKLTDEIWEYVSECEDIGWVAFKEKYKEHRLYF